MREIIDGIRAAVPGLRIVVRLSAFDLVPHRKGADGSGVPAIQPSDYRSAFGLFDGDLDVALAEAKQVLSCSRIVTCDGCASRPAAPITVRIRSDRPCFLRATATIRRRIRCMASRD
jgi:hypothetical protein